MDQDLKERFATSSGVQALKISCCFESKGRSYSFECSVPNKMLCDCIMTVLTAKIGAALQLFAIHSNSGCCTLVIRWV